MSGALLGYVNHMRDAALSAGSEAAGLPVANLAGDQGAAAAGWQTAAGVVTPAAGAFFVADAGTPVSWRAFALARTNLTTAALARWRVGPIESVAEAAPFLDVTLPATGVLPGGTYTRGGAGAHTWDASGVLVNVPANTPRPWHDPATGAYRGWLFEALATNSIVNPRAEGAVAGSPGTPPTGWDSNVPAGLTRQIVGTGTEDGIPYLDVRFSGTPTTLVQQFLYFATGVQIPALVSQGWALSAFVRVVAGSFANISNLALSANELNASSALIELGQTLLGLPSAANLRSGRVTQVRVTTNAACAFIRPALSLVIAATGLPIDITLRIGAPQAERDIVSSPILPPVGSPAATLRGTDEWTWTLAGAPTTALTLAAEYTQITSTTIGGGEWNVSMDDGATNINRLRILVAEAPGTSDSLLVRGGVVVGNLSNVLNTVGVPRRQAVAADASGMAHSVAGGAVDAVTTSGAPVGLTRLRSASNRHGVALARVRIYAGRLTNGQVRALATDWSTLDTASLTYDSGLVSAGVAAGYAQSILVAPAEVTGRAARCDISDAGNPDGFVNIPLAFAGPAWSPPRNIGFQSSVGADSQVDEIVTRGGQEYPALRFTRRRWNIALDLLETSTLWATLGELLRVARLGRNILLIPRPLSADRSREAVFGRVRNDSDIVYTSASGRFRSWRASIVERL